jgi:hypothetical protein
MSESSKPALDDVTIERVLDLFEIPAARRDSFGLNLRAAVRELQRQKGYETFISRTATRAIACGGKPTCWNDGNLWRGNYLEFFKILDEHLPAPRPNHADVGRLFTDAKRAAEESMKDRGRGDVR